MTVAGWILALAAACAVPTDEVTPPEAGLLAAQGGGGPNPAVDSTVPSQAPQDTTLDVAVLGSNYEPGSQAAFLLDRKASPKVRTNSTTFVSPGRLIANITIAADADVAKYDVQVVTLSGKKGIGIERFEVTQRTNPGQWEPPILTVTMRQGSTGTDAVRADDPGNSPYDRAAHIAINGNLMFWLGSTSPRAVLVSASDYSGATRRRIFTNSHTNPGGDDGLGLLGMAPGSAGTAVFEVELHDDSAAPYDVLRYGKDCAGSSTGGNVVPATKATTTRSADGRTWTITGTSGVHCKQVGKKPRLTEVGTAGPFSLTLVEQP